MSQQDDLKLSNFIQQRISNDLAAAKHSKVITRFPPEPNGHLHIGHAKSICLNFGLAQQFNGECHLRFDDTNPEKESQAYVDAIKADVSWLGFQWHGPIRYTSDYFQQLHDWAVELIKVGKAYVCDLTPEQAKEYRGDFSTTGKDSPFRDRTVEENLALFADMKAGKFAEGSCALRAKIDMASPSMILRDPMLYRILHKHHHQTAYQWCIYPIYDFAHGQSDAIEKITHSICTLEFEEHRPLYEWFLNNLPVPAKPEQIEFARLGLGYTVMSKRKLKQLVDEQLVSGWDDPRMPTISGLRRRGYTPKSIRNFCDSIGVTRSNSSVDISMLEASIREDLDVAAPRAMCVLEPLKVTITNFAEDQVEWLEVPAHPKNESLGSRKIALTRDIFIEQSDFSLDPPKKWKRLNSEAHVRLRGAYVIRCDEVITDSQGEVIELRCSYDPATKGTKPEGYKPNGVVHWVSALESHACEARVYERLFTEENPEADKKCSFLEFINPDSLIVYPNACVEIGLKDAPLEQNYQFERQGYFSVDPDSSSDKLVVNRTVSLRDSWAKQKK